jgi:hypothetical protein
VLIFLLKLPEDISMKELEKQAKKLIPPWRSRDWHNALMDYGAIYLTAKKTNIKSVGKQSKFEGSNREVRGWIVKQLVNNEQRRDGSWTRPPTSYSITIQHIKSEFPHKEVEKIVQGLIDEGIVKMKKGEISIVN